MNNETLTKLDGIVKDVLDTYHTLPKREKHYFIKTLVDAIIDIETGALVHG